MELSTPSPNFCGGKALSRSRPPGVARLCCTPRGLVFNPSGAEPILLDPGCFPAGMGMLEPILVALGLGWCRAHPEHPRALPALPLPGWNCPLVPSLCLFPCCLFFLVPKSHQAGRGVAPLAAFCLFYLWLLNISLFEALTHLGKGNFPGQVFPGVCCTPALPPLEQFNLRGAETAHFG